MEGYCFLCGRYGTMEMHHVFNGALKRKSERYGAVVPLCHSCHNEPPEGVHFNVENAKALKQALQGKIMQEQGWGIEDWLAVFGKNYI